MWYKYCPNAALILGKENCVETNHCCVCPFWGDGGGYWYRDSNLQPLESSPSVFISLKTCILIVPHPRRNRGTADVEIKVTSAENSELSRVLLKLDQARIQLWSVRLLPGISAFCGEPRTVQGSLFEAWSRPGYSCAGFACFQEYLPSVKNPDLSRVFSLKPRAEQNTAVQGSLVVRNIFLLRRTQSCQEFSL